MIELGAAAGVNAAGVLVDAVVCIAVPPDGVVVVVVVRDDSLPDSSPRSVSAMRVASALRRKTT
jgi:hypothetical protein